MVAETEFYDRLGVPPNADEGVLKKAYRKKALQLHPDKNPAGADEFKLVSEAYDVLSNPEKRDLYDRFGKQGLEGGGGMGGMDPQDLFSQLFGGGMFGGGGGRRGPTGPKKGKDLVHRIKVSLEELYRGKTTKIALQKHVLCPKCDGKGGKAGSIKSCAPCKGQGVKMAFRQLGPMVQQVQQVCQECRGEGEIIAPKDRCKACDGKKISSERKVLDVHIDKGMKEGQTIVFSGEADQAPGTVPGDVVIVIEEKPHPRFKRRGNDLVAQIELDLLTALAGGKIPIEHLDDRVVVATVRQGEVVKPGSVKIIPDQGMPSYRHHEPGDLILSINVVFPESLPADSVAALESVLPPRPQAPTWPKSHHIEDVQLVNGAEHHARSARATNGSADAMDTDDEDGGQGGGPQVQCANQ